LEYLGLSIFNYLLFHKKLGSFMMMGRHHHPNLISRETSPEGSGGCNRHRDLSGIFE
jgi:hypothetical protein